MTEFSERSGLFKFFYIFLRIITFPIFIVLFILRHPLWLLLLLLMLAGGAVYWPMSQGVQTDELLDWYKKKYVVVKKDVVKTAKEKGLTNFVPQSIVEEVEQMEDPEIAEDAPRSENYNVKVVRDAKSTETRHILKKRGGFKKAAESEVVKVEKNLEDMTDEEVLQEGGTQGGGLAGLLVNKNAEETDKNEEAQVEEVAESATDTEGTVNEAEAEEVSTNETAPEAEPESELNLMPKEEAAPTPQEDSDLDLF